MAPRPPAALLLAVATALMLACAAEGARLPAIARGGEHPERSAVERVVRQALNSYKTREPIIGVVTQPCTECPGRSYIGASYVKWIESAGGRVAPIRFYASDTELRRLFNSVNGLLFPGGLTWLWLDAPYVMAARKLFQWAVESNEAGDPFPIHGTCLGFQLLHILAANVSRDDLLVETDSVTHATTLDFQPGANKSRTFAGLPADLWSKLSDPSLAIAMENHEYGIPPAHYRRWPLLADWYRVITTTRDRKQLEYISTVEHNKYPFTGTQWHPEKPTSEFGMAAIPHTLDGVRVGQFLANQFVDAARRSSHKPKSPEQELIDLIYGTPPVFSARFETIAEDNYDGPYITYYFDTKDKPPTGPDDDQHEGGESDDARASFVPSKDASVAAA